MKSYKKQEEIDNYAHQLLKLRAKSTKSKKALKAYMDFESACMEHFKYLVIWRTSKYKRFANFQDLEQDAYEALLMALKTFDEKKGSFTWWADKYISTRVSRRANTHSTIRIPLKKTKDMKPIKINDMPEVLDENSINSFDTLYASEVSEKVHEAIKELPEPKVIQYIYGVGKEQYSVAKTAKTLGLSRTECLKILEDSIVMVKEKLKTLEMGETHV